MAWRDAVALGLVSGGTMLVLATGMAVPRAAAQPAATQSRPVLVVSETPPQDGNAQQFATLDEAVEVAGRLPNPLVLVDPGDYTLAGAITQPLELRARSLGPGPLTPIDWANCPGTVVTPGPTSVVVKSAGTGPAVRVALANSEGRVVIAGIGLLSSPEGTAAAVSTGELLIRDAVVSGRVVAGGAAARTSLANVVIQPGGGTAAVTPFGGVDGGVGAYGLPFAGNDCDLALVSVTNGARYQARNVEIKDHPGIGICVDAATAILCGGSIHDISVTSEGGYGRGANVLRGGRLGLHNVHVYDVREAGAAATGSGTEVVADQGTRIERVGMSSDAQLGVGVLGQSRASVRIEDCTITGCEGPGLYLSRGATGTAARTTYSTNQGAGVVVYGATMSLDQSTVQGTQSHPGEGMGLGIYIDNRVFGASAAAITGCTVEDNLIAGIWVEGDGGTASVSGTTVARHSSYTLSNGMLLHGNGVIAREVCAGLSLTGNSYTGNASAQVYLMGSNASLSGSSYATNGVLDFLQEGCTRACVTPLTLAGLAADGLSSTTHVISLCPQYDTPTLSPEFAFGLVEVTIQSR